MTTTATAPACPKCGGAMWDQKNGKFPWKPGTPIFKCKTKECATAGGVYWEDKGPAIAAPPKSSPPKQPISYSNTPDKDLPPELRSVPEEEIRELREKIGEVPTGLDTKARYAWSQLQSLKIALDVLVPLYEEKEIGLTDDVIHKHSFELFKTWCDKGLVV